MKKRKGFALILTLSVIVLLTGLLLSLLSLTTNKRIQTKSATESMRVEALARGAADKVAAEFISEIKSNSEILFQESTGTNPRAVYKPQPGSVNPARLVHPKLANTWNSGSGEWSNPAYLNLIRQSLPSNLLSGKSVTPLLTNATSPVQTSETLDPSTWNKIQLTLGQFEENTAPNWVYLDRTGNAHAGNSSSYSDKKNDEFIVGRYAYNVYNVGGLLDVNTAGISPATAPEVMTRKGNPLSLDITKIPGFDAAGEGQLAQFFNWRDNTLDPDTLFDVEGYNGASDDGYIAKAGKKGWLSPITNAEENRNSNRFISRSDLIASLTKLLGPQNATNALPHLSTENRFVERPNHIPDPGLPQVKFDLDQGGSDADDYPTANDGTWAMSDGKIKPLLASRFPLDRIALFQNAGANAPKIEEYFGLKFSGGYWEYVHQGSGNEILTLDQVVSLDREPNFFEILKAAIHSGSLGIQHGSNNRFLDDDQINFQQAGNYDRENLPFTLKNGRDGTIDFQLVKIGANIIDQYDDDSFPTVVAYPNGELPKNIAGVEAIPQIYTLQSNIFIEEHLKGFKPEGFNFDTGQGRNWDEHGTFIANSVLQTRLWNPNVAENLNSDLTPTEFRIEAELLGNSYPPFAHIGHSENSSKLFKDNTDVGLEAKDHPWHLQREATNKGSDFQKVGLNDVDNKIVNYDELAGLAGLAPEEDEYNYGTGMPENPATILTKDNLILEYSLQPTEEWPYTFSDPRTLTASGYPSSKLTINGDRNTTFACIQDIMRPGFNQSGEISGYKTIDEGSSHTVHGFPLGKLWMGPAVKKKNEEEQVTPIDKIISDMRPYYPVMLSRMYTYGPNITLYLSYKDRSGNWVQFDEKMYFGHMLGALSSHKGESKDSSTKVAASTGITQLRSTFYFDPRDNRWGPIFATSHPTVLGANNNKKWANVAAWKEGRSIQHGDQYFLDPITYEGHNGTPPYSPDNKLFTAELGQHIEEQKYTANYSTNPAGVAFNNKSSPYTYVDPDGIQRSPMGKFWAAGSYEGQPMAAVDPDYADSFQDFNPSDIYQTSEKSEIVRQNRPIILNRPFHSVGELGYVFSGTPWRNLDFFTVESGDKHLLEYFCLHTAEAETTADGSPIVGGRVDLNAASVEVVESMLASAGRDYSTSDPLNQSPLLDEADITTLAQTIISYTNDQNYRPFLSKADLVGYYEGEYKGLSDELGAVFPSLSDEGGHDFRNKNRREAVVRSLASLGETGTWNLVVDLVAEVGSLKKGSSQLDDFVTRAQSHLWLHLTIDRYTGEIIHQKIEQAY